MTVPQVNSSDEQVKIFSPVALPCGVTLQNRLVKVALYEHLGDFCGGPPNAYHNSLYSKWAQSDWGMIITGNVQVSRRHLSAPRDIIIPEVITETSLKPFKALANAMHDSGKRPEGLAIMQISHSGRQSASFMGGRLPFEPPLAPSAVPINPGPGVLSNLIYKSMFQTPREMTLDDVEDVVVSFVRGAKVAMLSGFDGIQLHAAHGFLLAQFISPKTNKRTDDYSAHPDNALRLLERITRAIRAAVPKSFVVGVKINAADYVPEEYKENGSRNSHDALQHICAIASWGLVDFIEISGGDYETPTVASPSKKPRQVLYSVYSQRALESLSSLSLNYPTPLILLTGGLQTPEHFYSALSAPHAHLLGVGRLSILLPQLPILLQRREDGAGWKLTDDDWSVPFRPHPDLQTSWILPKIPFVGMSTELFWYNVEMRRLASTSSVVDIFDSEINLGLDRLRSKPPYSIGGLGAWIWFWVWFDMTYFLSWIWYSVFRKALR